MEPVVFGGTKILEVDGKRFLSFQQFTGVRLARVGK
jgi:hypothetical protein